MSAIDLPKASPATVFDKEEPSTAWGAFKGGFVDANSLASQVIYDQRDEATREEEAQEARDYVAGKYDYNDYMPEQYEDYSILYAQTSSPRTALNLTNNLNKKYSYYEDMSGHPVATFMGNLAGGVSDPYQIPLVLLLPTGSMLSKAARARWGLTEHVSYGVKVGMAAGALAEATNVTPGRTGQEQLYSTLASGLFNGVLSGAGHQFGLMREAVNEVDIDMRTIDTHPILSELGPIPKYDGEVPAAVQELAIKKIDEEIAAGNLSPDARDEAIDMLITDTVQTSSMLKYPKFYKMAAFMSPGIRLAASNVHEGRVLNAALTTVVLQRKSMKVDPPIDVLLRMQTDQAKIRTTRIFKARYDEYLKATPENRMTQNEFSSEISQAIADGGVHGSLFIQSAAKDMIKVMDGIQARRLKMGLVKHGYDGFENVKIEDLIGLGLTSKQKRTLLRLSKVSDEERMLALADFKGGQKKFDAEKQTAKLRKKYFPDEGTQYQRYATGLNRLANRILLATSAKTRAFRARVKELETMYLTGNDNPALDFEFEMALDELMVEFKVPNANQKTRALERKYFDVEGQQAGFDQAVIDAPNVAKARREAEFAAEQGRLRESKLEIEVDKIKDLPEEMLAKLHENGRLDKINVEDVGDIGYMFRLWDARKVAADSIGFETHFTALLKEQFETAKTKSDIDARIIDTEEAIAKLRAKLKAEEEGPKVKTEASQEEFSLQQELDYMKQDASVPKHMIKELEDDIAAMVKARTPEESMVSKQIADRELELERLQKRKSETWEDLVDQIPGFVRDLRSRILHQNHKGGFKAIGLNSETLGDRTIHLPYAKIKGWLNSDVTESLHRYYERALPEILMAERFGGKGGFSKEVNNVLEKYDDLATANPERAAKIMKEKSNYKRDIEAMEDTIFRRYGLSENPDGILHKGGQYVRWMNMVNNLGLMAFSAIPDLGSIIARQGMNAVQFHRYMWAPEGKVYRAYLDDIGITADVVLGHAHERFTIADESFMVHSRFDAAARSAVKMFNMLTGMNHWNAYLKRFVAGVYGMGIVRDAHKFKAGKLSAKHLDRYRTAFLTEQHLLDIADITTPGKPLDVTNWAPELHQRFSAAIFNEANTVIVTPTLGDLPLMAANDLGKIVLQFKSFAIASNHKLVLSSIDDVTAQKMIGIMAMVFFGHVSQTAKSVIKGEPLSDDPKQLTKNAVASSGVGMLGVELNAIVERLTSGQLSAWNALGLDTGEAITFNQNMSALDLALGPTAGLLNNVKHVATMAASGDVRESDIRAMRRLVALNNLWLTYRGFNKLEELANKRWAR